jgi:hypothetical protein
VTTLDKALVALAVWAVVMVFVLALVSKAKRGRW